MMTQKRTYIAIESPIFEVVERFRKSRASYATGYDVGDRIRFSGRITPNRGASGGGVFQSYFDIVKVNPDGSEEVVGAEVSQSDISKFFVIDLKPENFPKWDTKPIFRIAEEAAARAIRAGVPLEDIYAAS